MFGVGVVRVGVKVSCEWWWVIPATRAAFGALGLFMAVVVAVAGGGGGDIVCTVFPSCHDVCMRYLGSFY